MINDEEERQVIVSNQLGFNFSLDPEPAVFPEVGVVPVPLGLGGCAARLTVTRGA